MSHILLADDNPAIIEFINDIIRNGEHILHPFKDGVAALEAFQTGDFDLVITDISMPGIDGFQFLSNIRAINNIIPVIMITGVGGIDDAVHAIRQGASDFVVKPFNPEEFRNKIEKNLQIYALIRENERLKRGQTKKSGCAAIVGHSAPMKRMISQIMQVARSNASIMILGESGTGKELVARAIHEESNRSDKPFIAVDCSTLSESIMESELFGHSKGAFTGADRSRKGILEEANGGTVFLDEIGNLTMQTQSKLLRFLQEREIKPVGMSHSIKVDVRIVSATNLNLRNAIEKREFREDLYYRLSGIEIIVPPLRDRLGDIPFLVSHFIRKYATEEMNVRSVDEEALLLLSQREWKGNVRELEHLIEHAVIVENGNSVSRNTLMKILPENADNPYQSVVLGREGSITDLETAVSEFEADHLRKVIGIAGGNRVKASKLLGISRSVLYEKMKRYGIE
ncbi:MAG TPA: sigma-54 dependent transcriptional regulator [Spirochaetota bacterium]|nr:sigma-54 dependent transcriptional regulator [Spirochaetota bacterium]